MRDLIQSEKEISRPSQEEAGFKALAEDGMATCASCRWFKSADGDYCHLIQNTPLDVSARSTCERHEAQAMPDIPEPEIKEQTPPENGGVFVADEIPDPNGDQLPALLDDALKEVELPPAAKERLWNRIAERLGMKIPFREKPEQTGLKVAGNHWFIVWSNNFADLEGEIFTAKAMDDYVRRVDMGIVPPPDLVVWHMGAKTKMGRADWVARHGHFLVASGEFDASAQGQKAKAYYRRNARKTAVSHGYTYPAKQFDGKHYHSFNTFEISLLPRGKEANRFTSLERIKAMTVTPEKEKYLREVFGEEADALLSPLDELGKSLETMGTEFKEFKDFTAVPETPAEPATETVEADVKALVGELVSDQAQVAQWTLSIGNAVKAYKEAADTQFAAMQEVIDAQSAEIAALKEVLDGRPKSASSAEETTLDAARLKAISEQADKQLEIVDPFWGTRRSATAT